MNSKEIKKYIDDNYLYVRVMFEVVGRPKEHVQTTVKSFVEKIKQDEELVFVSEDYDEAEEVEDGVFGAIAETELLVPNAEKLTWLCINFTPASLEILEPSQITIEQKELTNWYNDLLSRLHEIGVNHKALGSQYQGLVRNFNAMTRNAILLVLKESAELEQIAKRIGMTSEHTEQFLEALIKEKKIKKDKNKYQVISSR
ncbi:hypothetical protein K9M74_02190 [Candidatus Woesearchaeota archaeon]|nr:hypothetical protein [Candidatus Woesearchaeota archaeon]